MPRLVVPSLFLPRKRSVTRSSSWWYGMIRCAFPETPQEPGVDALRLEHVELVEEHCGVDDHAVADDRRDPRVEHAARHELELEDLAVDDDRVARVVAALVADAQRSFLGEVVGEATLALVAPLHADDHCARHRDGSREMRSRWGHGSADAASCSPSGRSAGAEEPWLCDAGPHRGDRYTARRRTLDGARRRPPRGTRARYVGSVTR